MAVEEETREIRIDMLEHCSRAQLVWWMDSRTSRRYIANKYDIDDEDAREHFRDLVELGLIEESHEGMRVTPAGYDVLREAGCVEVGWFPESKPQGFDAAEEFSMVREDRDENYLSQGVFGADGMVECLSW